MPQTITPDEANAALHAVERERRTVIGQVALPAWYWWGLAVGWIALGVIADQKIAWLTSVSTLAFGAIHSAVAPRVIDGRHGNERVRVARDVVGRQVTWLVLGGLVVLAGVTIGAAFAANADGARDPATIASILVAVILVLGGPRLLEVARGRLARAGR
jgi:4-hydroxybenzoate polyprenyltransferase